MCHLLLVHDYSDITRCSENLTQMQMYDHTLVRVYICIASFVIFNLHFRVFHVVKFLFQARSYTILRTIGKIVLSRMSLGKKKYNLIRHLVISPSPPQINMLM